MDRAPLLQVLAAVLGLTVPDGHVDEQRLLLALAVLARPASGWSPAGVRSRPCRSAFGAARGRTSGDPSETLCSSRPSSDPSPGPTARRTNSFPSRGRKRLFPRGSVPHPDPDHKCQNRNVHRPSRIRYRPAEPSTITRSGRDARRGRGTAPAHAHSSRRRRRGRSSCSSSRPSSASTFGVEVIAWLTRWSTSLGWTFRISSRRIDVAEVAVGDDLLEVRPVGLEVGQQVRPLLVTVDRVGEPALVPLAAGHDLGVVLRQDVVDVLDRVVPGDGDLRAVQQEHPLVGVDRQVRSSSRIRQSWSAGIRIEDQPEAGATRRSRCRRLDPEAVTTRRQAPLNRFMAASRPWVTQTATACVARIRASSMTGRSAPRNRLRTKSAASIAPRSPIPIRSRA